MARDWCDGDETMMACSLVCRALYRTTQNVFLKHQQIALERCPTIMPTTWLDVFHLHRLTEYTNWAQYGPVDEVMRREFSPIMNDHFRAEMEESYGHFIRTRGMA